MRRKYLYIAQVHCTVLDLLELEKRESKAKTVLFYAELFRVVQSVRKIGPKISLQLPTISLLSSFDFRLTVTE